MTGWEYRPALACARVRAIGRGRHFVTCGTAADALDRRHQASPGQRPSGSRRPSSFARFRRRSPLTHGGCFGRQPRIHAAACFAARRSAGRRCRPSCAIEPPRDRSRPPRARSVARPTRCLPQAPVRRRTCPRGRASEPARVSCGVQQLVKEPRVVAVIAAESFCARTTRVDGDDVAHRVVGAPQSLCHAPAELTWRDAKACADFTRITQRLKRHRLLFSRLNESRLGLWKVRAPGHGGSPC
jgi:hypothetical protein